MRGERVLVNQIRELMEPGNPVPATRYQGEPPYQAEIAALLTELRSAPPGVAETMPVDPVPVDRPGRRPGRDTAWRVLAPVLSGLAVVAVVTTLTVAAGPGPSRSTGGPRTSAVAVLPRFFATFDGTTHSALIIHRTSSGKTVARVPALGGVGPVSDVAAGRSGRVFYIAINRLKGDQILTYIESVTLSASGRVLARYSVQLPQFTGCVIHGIAVSPNGRRFALAADRGARLEIAVFALTDKSASRVWVAPSRHSAVLDPVWTSNRDVAFLWQRDLVRSGLKFGGLTQERVLNTSRSGIFLQSSKVLLTSPTGVMETAYASPGGGPIFASIATDKPTGNGQGVATVRLVVLLPHRSVFTLMAFHKQRYHNPVERDAANLYYRVFGLDPSGQHALVDSPGFGTMKAYKITPLPGVHGPVTGAAW